MTLAHRSGLARLALAVLVAAGLLLGASAVTVRGLAPNVLSLQLVASGFTSPLDIDGAGDGSGRLFIAEQGGYIRAINSSGAVQSTLLDIHTLVSTGYEQGLLGVDFHPSFSSNGRYYVHYTDLNGDIVIAEFTSADRATTDVATRRQLLLIDHPDGLNNHNGGGLAFGPDGFLYVAVGEGGGETAIAQDTSSLLGKILRIDVNSTSGSTQYGIPAGNPFAGGGGAPEIWSYGLRNPFRFSFDRATGEMWIGDVGSSSLEEVDREPAGAGGRNYGWNIMEGSECNGGGSCDETGLTLPWVEYPTDIGCVVTGGHVYRGTQFDFQGEYVFADHCAGLIWTVDADGGSHQMVEQVDSDILISSFGENDAGELFVADLREGRIYQLVGPPAPTPSPTPTPTLTPAPTATAVASASPSPTGGPLPNTMLGHGSSAGTIGLLVGAVMLCVLSAVLLVPKRRDGAG